MSRYYTPNLVDKHGYPICGDSECDIRVGCDPTMAIKLLVIDTRDFIVDYMTAGRKITIKMIPVRWRDCWIKSTEKKLIHKDVGLISLISLPPGGNVYWHVPDDDVYAMNIEVEG